MENKIVEMRGVPLLQLPLDVCLHVLGFLSPVDLQTLIEMDEKFISVVKCLGVTYWKDYLQKRGMSWSTLFPFTSWADLGYSMLVEDTTNSPKSWETLTIKWDQERLNFNWKDQRNAILEPILRGIQEKITLIIIYILQKEVQVTPVVGHKFTRRCEMTFICRPSAQLPLDIYAFMEISGTPQPRTRTRYIEDFNGDSTKIVSDGNKCAKVQVPIYVIENIFRLAYYDRLVFEMGYEPHDVLKEKLDTILESWEALQDKYLFRFYIEEMFTNGFFINPTLYN
ncbi:hypothetical protein MGYG_08576 [Nannizzia gypsea CBS 118893]|uniref:F-box domain-containing protein n=1 Tax=Arthroderma gypseum (strain ATCC MYA-4604 / CBS 118893) TaxID=535722 RepID=E4V635_ARTGP|nr:hypothetical protein MGYG_08576 [Nannizzia gypsea CBS 118893]EFR05560.1 hypothetical protein MGYG_08576 [Nannizzia gypsea CBS 118893]